MKKIYLKVTFLTVVILTVLSLIYFFFLEKKVEAKTIATLRENIEDPPSSQQSMFFIGTHDGLYKINGSIHKIYPKEVLKVLISPRGLWLLTKNDLLFSHDYKTFESRSLGIRQKIIKSFDGKQTSLIQENELLKDLALDPQNPDNLITAGMNGVYYTTNNGKSWIYVPSNSATNGIKSVGIYSWEGKIHLLFGHPYKGVFHQVVGQKKWDTISRGLSEQGGFHDEISTIQVLSNGLKASPTVRVAQNFDPTIFQVDFHQRKLIPIFSPKKQKSVQLLDSLQETQSKHLLYVQNDGVQIYNPEDKTVRKWEQIKQFIQQFQKMYKTQVNSITAIYNGKPLYSLSELWMLSPPNFTNLQKKASGKQGVYVQADALRSKKRLPEVLDLLAKNHLNMIVVDMKDDYGYLRFTHHNDKLSEMGIVKNPLQLSKTLPLLKSRGIYVVARIPVFKDAILYRYNNGEYAIKDSQTQGSWEGLKRTSKGGIVPTKEYWVDPYNEHVWAYNAEIATELIKQGIDEIQFDYIRFPTDGLNIKSMSFPAQEKGMDKESALISFLRFVRGRLSVPISVDIYGANGWMRTGARTGQDVELLSQYVDVIAPMYYPSHFGKTFLNFPPYEERPYRIYNIGSYRNYYIARQKSIIRPYVQAFELSKNAYDAQYYGVAYVNREIQGIQESINLGYTFWNSSTKYSILYDSILNDSN